MRGAIDMRPLDQRLTRIYVEARDNKPGVTDVSAGLRAVYWEGVRVGSAHPSSPDSEVSS